MGILKHPTIVSSLLITGLVLGVRHMGGLQSLELLAYDKTVRLRSDAGQDERLLVLSITEDDIQRQNRYPISDEVVAKLIAKLQQYQPRTIGLDLYRDVPQVPGNAELLKQLQAPNVVSVMLLGDAETGGVAPPKGVPPKAGRDLVICWLTRMAWCGAACSMPIAPRKPFIPSRSSPA